MSGEINNQPSTTQPTFDPYINAGGRRIKYRSTYSIKNALRYKHIFDKMIVEKQSVIYNEPGCNTYTVRSKLSDALRFLIDNLDKEIIPANNEQFKFSKDDYAKLRLCIQFVVESNGLLIRYNSSGSYNVGKAVLATVNEAKPHEKKWRVELEEFLAGQGDHPNPFYRSGIIISPEDKIEIENMLANYVEYFEWNIKSVSITVARK